MLISLRGTNGSAKSTVVRKFMTDAVVTPIYASLGTRLPEAYKVVVSGCKKPVFVLGPYVTQCGGCDRLQYDQLIELIEKYALKGHVLFEGIIVTSVYGRVGTLLEKYRKNAVFVFLDTPLEVCLERVEARRGKPRDDRLVKNVSSKYNSALRVRDKVVADKIMRAYTVSATEAPKFLVDLLCGRIQ